MGYNSKSPWLIHYDGSSCNGCDIEVLDSLMPLYDIERFGIINTGNPKHADIFLVTGSINAQNIRVVRHIYSQMLEPKVVVACGICACTGGVFRDCYNVIGGVNKVIPVDVYVPGCPPKPEAMIDGIIEAVGILEKKRCNSETVTPELPVKIVKPAPAPAAPAAPAAEAPAKAVAN